MWPAAGVIETHGITLDPLQVAHADEMVSVLADARLYAFTGGEPPTVEVLRQRYAAQTTGRSPDDSEGWLNWVIRDSDSQRAVGFVQATLTRADGQLLGDIAWVVGAEFQRRGYATRAADALVGWLRSGGTTRVRALIHPDNEASNAIARSLGLAPTTETIDGEVCWISE